MMVLWFLFGFGSGAVAGMVLGIALVLYEQRKEVEDNDPG